MVLVMCSQTCGKRPKLSGKFLKKNSSTKSYFHEVNFGRYALCDTISHVSTHFRVENKINCLGKTVLKCGLRNLQEELVLFPECAKDCERFHGFYLFYFFFLALFSKSIL